MPSVRIVVLSLVVVGLLPAGGHWEAGRDEPIRSEHRGSAPPTSGPARSSAQPISAQYFARLFQYQLARRGNHPNPLDTGSTVILNVRNARESVLTDPATWQRKTEYYQGAAALLVLDNRLREASNGDCTLADVFRWTNSHDGSVTYEEFRDRLVVWGNESIGRWLDSHVDGRATDNPRGVGLPATAPVTDTTTPSGIPGPPSVEPPPPSVRECLVRRHEQ